MHQYPDLTPDGCRAAGMEIRWQRGPIGLAFNGASVEVIIRAAIMRLDQYQGGPTRCDQNREALGHLHGALACLDNRFYDRQARGVIGQESP
jgi:hypothetical protein